MKSSGIFSPLVSFAIRLIIPSAQWNVRKFVQNVSTIRETTRRIQLKRKSVTITEKYNPDGTLATKITETVEEEDNCGTIYPPQSIWTPYVTYGSGDGTNVYDSGGYGGNGTPPAPTIKEAIRNAST